MTYLHQVLGKFNHFPVPTTPLEIQDSRNTVVDHSCSHSLDDNLGHGTCLSARRLAIICAKNLAVARIAGLETRCDSSYNQCDNIADISVLSSYTLYVEGGVPIDCD